MRILHLSDTHGAHHRLYNLPESDIIVHSGDIRKHNGTYALIKDWGAPKAKQKFVSST